MKYQWIIKAPLYIRKPHACPECGTQLRVDRREKVVSGCIKLRWKEFYCPQCKRHFPIDDVKRHEGIPV